MRADDRIEPHSAPGQRRAYRTLTRRIEVAASKMPFALSAHWRICAILRDVYGCKVSDFDEARSKDAPEIVDLVDRRIAWYLDQRRGMGLSEDQMRRIGARDVNALLPTGIGRDYARLAAMPALPPVPKPRRSAAVIDLAAFAAGRSESVDPEKARIDQEFAAIKWPNGSPEIQHIVYRSYRRMLFRSLVEHWCYRNGACHDVPCTCIESGRFEPPDLDGSDELRLIPRMVPAANVVQFDPARRAARRPVATDRQEGT